MKKRTEKRLDILTIRCYTEKVCENLLMANDKEEIV